MYFPILFPPMPLFQTKRAPNFTGARPQAGAVGGCSPEQPES